MTSVTRSNAQGTGGNMAQTTHQRRMHKVMKIAGYEFERRDARGHNTYVNAHGQHIGVPGTPKNEGHSARYIKQEIQRKLRERQGESVATTQISPVDVYLTMADRFLMTPAPKGDQRAQTARLQALEGWTRRVLERHGPVVAGDLIEAAERMGFPRVALQKARTRCGAVTINQGGQDKSKMWQVCLPEQVPDNKAPRMNPAAKTFGGEVERPEPEPDPYEGHVTELAAKVASNGKQPPTDQQAAFLLMAESLGMSLPDTTHATQVLDAVILSIESNLEALKAARAELA